MGKFDGVLLASDFDNTLVWTEDALRQGTAMPQVPERNREALRYFMANGGRFAISTGRALPAFRRFVDQVPMNAPGVVCNGAGLYDFQADRYIYTAVGRYFSQAVSEGDLTNRYPSAYMADFCVRHFRGTVIDWAFHKYAYPLSRQMESEFRFLCDLFRPARPVPAV